MTSRAVRAAVVAAASIGCTNAYEPFGLGTSSASASSAATSESSGEGGGAAGSAGQTGGAGSGASGGGGAATGGAPGLSCPQGKTADLVDTFDDGMLDPIWTIVGTGSVTEQGGALHVQPAISLQSFAGIKSQLKDLRDCSYAVDIVQVLPAIGPGMVYVDFWSDELNYLQIDVSVGQLWFRIHDKGVPQDAVVAYDPAAHRHWRIGESAGTVYFETSPDGVAWTGQAKGPSPSFVGAASVGLGTATAVDPSPGEALFDDINVFP